MNRINYFAYGSNMTEKRMRDRQVVVYSRSFAYLNGFQLCFNIPDEKYSLAGYANIIVKPEEVVEGVLYEVDQDSLFNLDKYEIGFERSDVTVFDKRNQPIEAVTYISWRSQNAPELLPSSWYMDYLLGGCDLLSKEYIQILKAYETIPGDEEDFAGPVKEISQDSFLFPNKLQ